MNYGLKNRQSGVTLLEVMIVAAIIAMISAFAYPSYTEYVMRAKRTAAATMLMQVADRQQQFFMDNKRYAADLTRLGFTANTIYVDEDGQIVGEKDTDQEYSVTISASSATTYTLTAAPPAQPVEEGHRLRQPDDRQYRTERLHRFRGRVLVIQKRRDRLTIAAFF